MAFSALNLEVSETDSPVCGEMLAAGQSREVYALPNRPDLLVKVAKQQPPSRRFFTRFKLLRELRRTYKQIVPLRREIREYERVANEGLLTAKHLQNFKGLVQTDKGIGMRVRAIRQNNGVLALTLQQVIDAGRYNARIHAAFVDFLRWFVSSKIVAADVHLNNIVFSEKDNTLVLIDGIGDKTFLPVRAWMPALNRRYKSRLALALYSQVAIQFMKASFKKQILILAIMIIGAATGIDMMDGQLIDG